MGISTTRSEGGSLKESLTVVTRKGQITIPAEIRRAIGLKQGDKVALALVDRARKQVSLRPVRSVAELTFGAVSPRRRPEDFQELRRLFEEGQSADVLDETPPAEQM